MKYCYSVRPGYTYFISEGLHDLVDYEWSTEGQFSIKIMIALSKVIALNKVYNLQFHF